MSKLSMPIEEKEHFKWIIESAYENLIYSKLRSELEDNLIRNPQHIYIEIINMFPTIDHWMKVEVIYRNNQSIPFYNNFYKMIYDYFNSHSPGSNDTDIRQATISVLMEISQINTIEVYKKYWETIRPKLEFIIKKSKEMN